MSSDIHEFWHVFTDGAIAMQGVFGLSCRGSPHLADIDRGIDDAMAILLAVRSLERKVEAMTSAAGFDHVRAKAAYPMTGPRKIQTAVDGPPEEHGASKALRRGRAARTNGRKRSMCTSFLRRPPSADCFLLSHDLPPRCISPKNDDPHASYGRAARTASCHPARRGNRYVRVYESEFGKLRSILPVIESELPELGRVLFDVSPALVPLPLRIDHVSVGRIEAE